MDDLLLHKNAQKNAQAFIDKPSHALLITGPAGSGKRTLAEHILAGLLKIPAAGIANYPYFYLVEKPEDKKEIPIDSVRGIITKLKLKTVIASKGKIDRAVLIDNAQTMSGEAQNALLKAIEEPPAGTVFILTASAESSVLPTVASRSQKMAVTPVGLKEALSYFENKYQDKDVESAWQLSGGLAGLLDALLKDDSEHPLKSAVETSKKLLSMNRYERLLFADSFSSDKGQLALILDALSRILAVLHKVAVNGSNAERSKKLVSARRLVNQTADSLTKNTSPKLAVMNLVLNLPV